MDLSVEASNSESTLLCQQIMQEMSMVDRISATLAASVSEVGNDH